MKKGDLIFSKNNSPCIFFEEISFGNIIFLKVYDVKEKSMDLLDIDLDKIDWWDEDYFWNGEDIEMCYQVKRLGYKIWYEASETIIHYKGSSSGLYTTAKLKVPKEEKINRAKDATRSMRIFIQKHFSELGPAPIVAIAWVGAWILEKYRLARIHLGLKYV